MPRERDEPVRLTKIYTRGGDTGETSLCDGVRVSKLDARIAAYGTVDELNSALGLTLATDCPEEIRVVLGRVQNELFDLGADLSVPMERSSATATDSTQSFRSSRASFSRVEMRPRHDCTSLARSAVAPSARRWSRPVSTR